MTVDTDDQDTDPYDQDKNGRDFFEVEINIVAKAQIYGYSDEEVKALAMRQLKLATEAVRDDPAGRWVEFGSSSTVKATNMTELSREMAKWRAEHPNG